MSAIFLIVDPDPFVAEDLSEIVRETVNGAKVIHSPGVDMHTVSIVDEMAVAGVFLTGLPEEPEMRGLVARLTQRDVALARIGKTGDRQLVWTGPKGQETRSFDADSVALVLRGWTRQG